MEQLLIERCNDIEETAAEYENIKSFHKKHFSSDHRKERIHSESLNPNGRFLKGKSFQ